LSLRAGCGAVALGLLVALAMFVWTELQTGQLPGLADRLRTAAKAGAPAGTQTAGAATPNPTRAPVSTPTALDTPTAVAAARPTAVPTAAPRPTATTAPRAPTTLAISAAELDAELKRQVANGAVPLRNPVLTLAPPDRVQLRGGVPVAVFEVPVEIEARLFVDDRGALRLSTTRVDAVGASLPAGVASALGQQIDAQGSQAVEAALPPGAAARRVAVESDRVTVELAPAASSPSSGSVG
jgi:hypothetical protein